MMSRRAGRVVLVLAGALAAVYAGGCALGPAALRVSHLGYSEVIRRTADQELLVNLVRLKYREAPSFLDVGSVSAQFRFEASTSVDGTINEGPNPVNPDRLGLGGGTTYEERPTITFTPLRGKEFVNQLLAPLQADVIVLLSGSGWSIDRVLRLTVQSMNGLDNASSASGPTPERPPRYDRFARVSGLFRRLQEKGLLEMGYESRPRELSAPLARGSLTLADTISAVSQGYAFRPAADAEHVVLTGTARTLVWRLGPKALNQPEAAQIVELLGLVPGPTSYAIRATGGTGSSPPEAPGARTEIHIATRSLLGAMFFLSQGIEVPPSHRRRGIVTETLDEAGQPFDWSRVTGDLLRVHSSVMPPVGAAVAVRHRGHWYYVDDADLSSKSTFALLGQLFALQAGGAESVTPVLTLPVGG